MIYGFSKQSSPIIEKTGTYTGNAAANRAIPHNLGRVPTMVSVFDTGEAKTVLRYGNSVYMIALIDAGSVQYFSVTACDSTNFYVGDGGNKYGNVNLHNYAWVAI